MFDWAVFLYNALTIVQVRNKMVACANWISPEGVRYNMAAKMAAETPAHCTSDNHCDCRDRFRPPLLTNHLSTNFSLVPY